MNTIFALAGVVIKELYRRKDFYVLFVLTALISLVSGAANFFNDSNIIGYLKEICLLLIWISALVVAVGTAARQIPAERENRTIYPLLAKPVTRGQVIVGKFLGCWLACGIALVMFYLFFALMTGLHEHRNQAPPAAAATQATTADHDHDHDHDAHAGEKEGTHHEESEGAAPKAGTNYVQAFWLHWMLLGIVIAMVLFGSVIFAAPSSNATITIIVILGILFVGAHLGKVALGQGQPVQLILQIVYFGIPHLEWYDIREKLIYNAAPVPWIACGLATLYAIAYTTLFLFLGWLAFRRQRLNV